MEINIEVLKLYEQAKKSIEILKKAGVKVAKIGMGVKDRAYCIIQELLKNGQKNKNIKALNPGKSIVNKGNGLSEKLYNPDYTKATNAVSKNFKENPENKIPEEIIK